MPLPQLQQARWDTEALNLQLVFDRPLKLTLFSVPHAFTLRYGGSQWWGVGGGAGPANTATVPMTLTIGDPLPVGCSYSAVAGELRDTYNRPIPPWYNFPLTIV